MGALGRTALVVLLAVWVVNGLVAPRVAVDLSKWLHPTPSALEFARTVESEMATGAEDISPPDRDASTQRLLAEYGVQRVEDLPINAVGVYLQESEEFGNRIFDRNYGALWDTFERQGTVHETLALARRCSRFARCRWDWPVPMSSSTGTSPPLPRRTAAI